MGVFFLDYIDVYKKSKYYSFDSKVKSLFLASAKITTLNRILLNEDGIYSWELDVLLNFFIEKELSNRNMNSENRTFIYMLNAIKSYVPDEEFDIVKLFLRQKNCLDSQEIFYWKIMRSSYLFNSSSQKCTRFNSHFEEKFGLEYKDIISFIIGLLKLVVENGLDLHVIPSNLYNENKKLFDLFTIERDEYISYVHESEITDYFYCLKLCESFPFIRDGEILYFPMPHALINSATNALFYRYTNGSDELRSLLGYALEDFLYNLVNDYNIYDEVVEEFEYYIGKNRYDSSDLMCRSKQSYLFIELKAIVPYAVTRLGDEKAKGRMITRIVSAMRQVCVQIRNFFEGNVNVFENQIEVDTEECFGLVCIMENAFIHPFEIYKEYAAVYHLDMESPYYKWLISHIKVCHLYDLERYVGNKKNIIDYLKAKRTTNSYDFVFCESC